MANLIILEGVSRTGKSSICKALSEKYGYKNISVADKMPYFIDNLPDFYHGMHVISNEFFKSFENETFILDRSFISELVYSKFFNRNSYIAIDDTICSLLHDNQFVIINLITTHQEYLKRIPKDKKIYSFHEFNKQKDLFYWYYENFKTKYSDSDWTNRFTEIDTNQFSIDNCIDQIQNLIINNFKTNNKIIVNEKN